MKNRYFVLLLVLFTIISKAQNVTGLSPGFKNALVYNFCTDTDGDGIADSDVDTNDDLEIQLSEASVVTNLSMGVSNFNGINAFTSLLTLYCSSGGSVVVSDNSSLKSITCVGQNLYSVTLSGLSQLEYLKCGGSEIFGFVSLSEVNNLKTLECTSGHLYTLDVSNLPALETLNCSNNLLSSLTIAADNNIINLNISSNPDLQFDLSIVPNLKSLKCGGCALNSINLNPLSQLEILECSLNPLLNTLDLTAVPNLKELGCRGNNLLSLDLSSVPNLESLNCSNNNIATLDPSNLLNLKNLECYSNNMTSLNIGSCLMLETINCQANDLTSLDTANLTNIKQLICTDNLLTVLPVANHNQLNKLICNKNQIVALDLSGLPSLEYLNCSENNLSTLDLTSSIILKELTCDDNQIANLNLTGIPTIESLLCNNNQLTELNISGFANLKIIACGYNQISAMNFDNLPKLTTLNLRGNLFTVLDFSLMGGVEDYYKYYLDDNPSLTYVNIKNGAVIRYLSSWHNPSRFTTTGCINLQFVCVDDFNINRVHVPTAQVSSYCTFTPGGTFNTITGTLTFDLDNNGCDENDYHAFNRVNISNGISTGATFTNSSGNYTFFTGAGNYTLTPVMEHPYYTISPESTIVNFANSDGSVQTQNFCVTPNGVHPDVEIKIIPLSNPMPGFNVEYQLIYINKGNQQLSGDITLTFDDAVSDFLSASPATANQSLNTLNWSYQSLMPFETRTITVILNVNSPQETPPVNIEDPFSLTAFISTISEDVYISDNTFVLRQTIIGSYDPNDKACLEGDTIALEVVGEFLTYMIRFQNLGNADAVNVVVKDIIDTQKLDIASLLLVGSSHPHRTKITDKIVEFIFENINLPAEVDDEAGSHGYVVFKIRTLNSLVAGDSVPNTAKIFFDYNFPVTTNTATTTVESLLAQNDFEDKTVSIFPNPVNDKLYISARQNITSIQLYDVQGRLIETTLLNATEAILNIGENANGIYFVKIYTEDGVKIEKLIKK